MIKRLRQVFPFLLVLTFTLFSSNLEAQYDFSNDEPKNIVVHEAQSQIDFLQPLLVTEIVTKDGRVIRGKLMDGPTAENPKDFIIHVRKKKSISIPQDNVKEYAWAVGDRRDLNLFADVGFSSGFVSRSALGFTPGISSALGFELPYEVLLTLNASITGMFSESLNEGSDVFFAFGLGTGYRFNRQESHVQTLALNIDFSTGFFNPEQTDPFGARGLIFHIILSPTFDYEFPMGRTSGVSLFTRFRYFTLMPELSQFVFGVAFRFYKGFPNIGAMHN